MIASSLAASTLTKLVASLAHEAVLPNFTPALALHATFATQGIVVCGQEIPKLAARSAPDVVLQGATPDALYTGAAEIAGPLNRVPWVLTPTTVRCATASTTISQSLREWCLHDP